jgi:hypothetical protein
VACILAAGCNVSLMVEPTPSVDSFPIGVCTTEVGFSTPATVTLRVDWQGSGTKPTFKSSGSSQSTCAANCPAVCDTLVSSGDGSGIATVTAQWGATFADLALPFCQTQGTSGSSTCSTFANAGNYLFGGTDVFSGQSLARFQAVDSGGEPESSKGTWPCICPGRDKCSACTGNDMCSTVPACADLSSLTDRTGVCAASDTPVPLTETSCAAGTNCRIAIGTNFAAAPPALQPAWAAAGPLNMLMVTTHSEGCINPGLGKSCDDQTTSSVLKNKAPVCEFNSNQPRNEIQNPLTNTTPGTIIPQTGDMFYVWWTSTPKATTGPGSLPDPAVAAQAG